METSCILPRTKCSCALDPALSEGRRPGKIWKNACVHRGVTSPSSAALKRISCANSAIVWVSSGYQAPSLQFLSGSLFVWTKPHLLGSVTDQHVSDARLNVPQAQRHAKLCQDTSNGAFHHEKTDGQSEKGQSLWKRNSSSHPPSPFFHSIALTGKHLICCNISWCVCPFN